MATIGADPELVVRRGGDSIAANNFIRDIAGQNLNWGQVGRDGAGGPLEIRPKPSFKPIDVVANIGHLLSHAQALAIRHATGSALHVGSYAPDIGGLGGHLHSWGRVHTRDKLHNAHNRARVCLGLSLLWALEQFDLGKTRRERNFGAINDIRRGTPTYEFRTPSSDWLASPGLAYHTLFYFQTLVDRVDDYGQDLDLVDSLLADALNFWSASTEVSRTKYTDKIISFVKKVVRPKDLSTILFYAERFSRLRDQYGLVRLDVDKWQRRAGCED